MFYYIKLGCGAFADVHMSRRYNGSRNKTPRDVRLLKVARL